MRRSGEFFTIAGVVLVGLALIYGMLNLIEGSKKSSNAPKEVSAMLLPVSSEYRSPCPLEKCLPTAVATPKPTITPRPTLNPVELKVGDPRLHWRIIWIDGTTAKSAIAVGYPKVVDYAYVWIGTDGLAASVSVGAVREIAEAAE